MSESSSPQCELVLVVEQCGEVAGCIAQHFNGRAPVFARLSVLGLGDHQRAVRSVRLGCHVVL